MITGMHQGLNEGCDRGPTPVLVGLLVRVDSVREVDQVRVPTGVSEGVLDCDPLVWLRVSVWPPNAVDDDEREREWEDDAVRAFVAEAVERGERDGVCVGEGGDSLWRYVGTRVQVRVGVVDIVGVAVADNDSTRVCVPVMDCETVGVTLEECDGESGDAVRTALALGLPVGLRLAEADDVRLQVEICPGVTVVEAVQLLVDVGLWDALWGTDWDGLRVRVWVSSSDGVPLGVADGDGVAESDAVPLLDPDSDAVSESDCERLEGSVPLTVAVGGVGLGDTVGLDAVMVTGMVGWRVTVGV